MLQLAKELNIYQHAVDNFLQNLIDNLIWLTNFVKTYFVNTNMNNFGIKIREVRESKGEPLRVVAFHLGIDQAILSKIENGKRKASRDQVEKIAQYYNLPLKDLVVEWLSDKIIFNIENDEYGFEALKVAEHKAKYLRQAK